MPIMAVAVSTSVVMPTWRTQEVVIGEFLAARDGKVVVSTAGGHAG